MAPHPMSSSRPAAPDLPVRVPLVGRAVEGIGTSLVAGALLGGSSWFSDQLAWPYSLLIPTNLIGVWLGVAFALGASARTLPTGALRGLIGLLAAIGTYYLLFAVIDAGIRSTGAGHAATVWGLVALVAGPVMGGAGAAWRHGTGWLRVTGVALLAAGLLAEGIAFGLGRLVHVDQLSVDPGALLFGIEIVLGALLPLLLLRGRDRLRGYAVTAAMGVVAVIAIGPITTALRAVADRF
jgi:hypothetical protein